MNTTWILHLLLSSGFVGTEPQGPDELPPPVFATPEELDTLPADLRHLVLYEPEDRDLARLARFRQLECLVLDRSLGGARLAPIEVTDDGLRALTRLTKLRVLHLHWCKNLTGAGLRNLESLPVLQELSLVGSSFEPEDLASLRSLRNLRALVLRGLQGLSDEDLDHVAALAGLQRLDLSMQTWLTPLGLVKLGALRQLRELNLNGVGSWYLSSRVPPPEHAKAGVDDTVLEVLGKLPDLEVLRLAMAEKITGKGVAHLSGLRKLRVLDLSHNDAIDDPDLMAIKSPLEELDLDFCSKITGHALPLFGDLKVLSLEGCATLEDGGFDEMPAEDLRELSLRWCKQLTGEVVACLPFFHRLERLDLGKCEWVTNDHLRTIARLGDLRVLSLDGCHKVTDEGLAHLKGMERLQELDLRVNPSVTVDGLLQLEGLRLRRLTVAACKRIGNGELAALRARWPACEIVR